MKIKKIRCQINDGTGVFWEYFDKKEGWQDNIRGWVSRIKNRYGLRSDATLSISGSPNGVTFNHVKTIAI